MGRHRLFGITKRSPHADDAIVTQVSFLNSYAGFLLQKLDEKISARQVHLGAGGNLASSLRQRSGKVNPQPDNSRNDSVPRRRQKTLDVYLISR
jgi:hypothetical protein